MTVSEMQTYTARLLGDPSNNTWDADDYVLPALNNAQKDFVIKLLGIPQSRSFDVLSELQASTTQTISTSGYALSGLDSDPGPFVRNGYIMSKATIDNEVKWVSRIPVSNLPRQDNYYMKGSDDNPLCYILTDTYYILIDAGTYSVSVTIYYIREPKELVASDVEGYQIITCEINPIYHEFLCEMATVECFRMKGDQTNMAKYAAGLKEIDSKIQSIAVGSVKEPQAADVESWRKNA